MFYFFRVAVKHFRVIVSNVADNKIRDIISKNETEQVVNTNNEWKWIITLTISFFHMECSDLCLLNEILRPSAATFSWNWEQWGWQTVNKDHERKSISRVFSTRDANKRYRGAVLKRIFCHPGFAKLRMQLFIFHHNHSNALLQPLQLLLTVETQGSECTKETMNI